MRQTDGTSEVKDRLKSLLKRLIANNSVSIGKHRPIRIAGETTTSLALSPNARTTPFTAAASVLATSCHCGAFRQTEAE